MTLPCPALHYEAIYQADLKKQDRLDNFHFEVSEKLMDAIMNLDPTEPEYLKRIKYKAYLDAVAEANEKIETIMGVSIT